MPIKSNKGRKKEAAESSIKTNRHSLSSYKRLAAAGLTRRQRHRFGWNFSIVCPWDLWEFVVLII